MRRPIAIAALLLAILSTATARAQDTSALINKALDGQISLTINSVLPKAMEQITEKSGIRIEADPAIWDLLPWGQDTNINARIENKTLREALDLITRKLALTFVLKDEAIELQPMPALRRLARRSTVQELGALDQLASTPADLADTQPTVGRLLEAVDTKLASLKSPYAIENRVSDVLPKDKRVFVARNATLMDALESIAKDTPATWYPWGKSILIVTKEDRIRALLQKSLTVRYNSVDVLQVLLELSARTGVRFDIAPGAIATVAPESRKVKAIFENATAQQILEAVSGSTGLSWTPKDDSVAIDTTATGRGPGGRDPVIGIIQLDMGIQVLLPTSQVPPDLREFIKARTNRELDKMRKMMIDEGFKPTTRPATQPNEDL